MKLRVKRHEVAQPQDTSIRLIPLTQGQNAIVDSTDYEWLSQWNWFALRSEHTKSYYACRTMKMISMAREILQAPAGVFVDHVNRNTLDNRRANLRLATLKENCRNCKLPTHNTTGFKGIHWNKRASRWTAQIRVNGKKIHLGSFSERDTAIYAYDKAAMQFHGQFASPNGGAL